LKEDYNSSIKEKGKEVIKIAEKEEKIEYLLPFDMDGELRKIDFLSKFENDVASRER
jgi:hypothetical protein